MIDPSFLHNDPLYFYTLLINEVFLSYSDSTLSLQQKQRRKGKHYHHLISFVKSGVTVLSTYANLDSWVISQCTRRKIENPYQILGKLFPKTTQLEVSLFLALLTSHLCYNRDFFSPLNSYVVDISDEGCTGMLRLFTTPTTECASFFLVFV